MMKRTEKDGVKDYGLGGRQHKQKMRESESEFLGRWKNKSAAH